MPGKDDLYAWKSSSKTDLGSLADPTAIRLLEAAADGEFVDIIYDGGSTPGATRSIQPKNLFKVAGYGEVYVEAYCELREENRVFRLDRLRLVSIDIEISTSRTTGGKSNRSRSAGPRNAGLRSNGRTRSSDIDRSTNWEGAPHQNLHESVDNKRSWSWLFWIAVGAPLIYLALN
jgi:predicted DNA-binding transcriptional regulator YafY